MRHPTRHITPLAGLAACMLLHACADHGAVAGPAARSLSVGGASRCYTVQFSAVLAPISATTLAGTVSGDLEGTVVAVFDESTPFTGATNMSGANLTWTITGGIVPELIGTTFVTRLDNRNILVSPTLVRNVGSLRPIAGVQKANVTYIGETPFPFTETQLDHSGVICP